MTPVPHPAGRLRRVLLGVLPALAACSSIGPGAVSPGRLDYSQSVADSWMRQALLNIVRLRYRPRCSNALRSGLLETLMAPAIGRLISTIRNSAVASARAPNNMMVITVALRGASRPKLV